MRCESDAIASAIEEADAEIVFESLDLKRNGGLGEKEMFRGLTEIQMFGNRAENLEAEIFQLGHVDDYPRKMRAVRFVLETCGIWVRFEGAGRMPALLPASAGATLRAGSCAGLLLRGIRLGLVLSFQQEGRRESTETPRVPPVNPSM